MAPREPNFMKIGFFDHCTIWVQTIIIVTLFLLLILVISTFQLMSGIKIDPAYFGLNIAANIIKR